jgi:arylsulfatase A
VPAQEATAAPAPPNVIFVLVDDLGWADLSCQGSKFYATPNIDRLAAQGVRFTQAYAAAAVCSPTRAAILTGRSPARTGITDWIRSRFQRPGGATPAANPTEYEAPPERQLACPPNPFWLDLEEVTLAELFRSAGYATCHVGKWHLGDDAQYPEHQGFDENHGGCDYGQPPTYFDPYRTERLPRGIPTLPPRQAGEYLTDREADEAVAFIVRSADRPFFLYLAHYAVHTPLEAKDDVRRRYAEHEDRGKRSPVYAALVESVDDCMGRLLDTLQEQGLAERTIVVFTSDNGGLLGPTDNAPLRSGKGHPHEGGIRVPAIVRWPGQLAPGRVSDAPVTSVDWLPTLCAAAGIALPERALDGVSLLPHLRDAGVALPARRLFWFFPHYRGDETPYAIVRAGDLKLIERFEGSVELFDLAADPREQHDVAKQRPTDVVALRAALAEQLAATGARLPRRRVLR